MPIKITGKIVDEFGLSLISEATVSEVPPGSSNTGSADVTANAQTGEFTIYILNPNSLIRFEAFGYKPISFPAAYFTALAGKAVVKLQEAVYIEANTPPKPEEKPDNTWLWVAGGIAVVAVIAVATGTEKKPVKAKGLSVPRMKKNKVKPLKVTV
ncbi:hypothetical protein [Flavobacterium sp.]|uniref:hypothetical protein n=1 Tax=Flavobacterium sp. TaxID=239 RepID=UPI004034A13B